MAGLIKSVQKISIALGSTVLTNTQTITSVNTAKSVIEFAGEKCDSATDFSKAPCTVELTNATTVTATRNQAPAGVTETVVGTVIEFN